MQKVIQQNGYFAHSDNVLIAMLCDKQVQVRTEAATIILSARQRAHLTGKYDSQYNIKLY